MSAVPLTRRAVFSQAWPIILGQALVPTVGLVDATIIGRTGDPEALAGVALGATVVTLIFWTFGFLRMGITGLTAQASGAGEDGEVLALLLRGVVAGVGIGAVLTLLHRCSCRWSSTSWQRRRRSRRPQAPSPTPGCSALPARWGRSRSTAG
jgi:MATE family multidrug resistance protein